MSFIKIYFAVLCFTVLSVHAQDKVKHYWGNGELKEKYTNADGYILGKYYSYYNDGKTIKAEGKYSKSKHGFNSGSEKGYYKTGNVKYIYSIDDYGNETASVYDSITNKLRTVTLNRKNVGTEKTFTILSEIKGNTGTTLLHDLYDGETKSRTYTEYYSDNRIKRQVIVSYKKSDRKNTTQIKGTLLKKLSYLDNYLPNSIDSIYSFFQTLSKTRANELEYSCKEFYENGSPKYIQCQKPFMLYQKELYKQWFNVAGNPVLDSVWVSDTLNRVWKHHYILSDTMWVYSTLAYKKDTFNFMNLEGFYEYSKKADLSKQDNQVSDLFNSLVIDKIIRYYANDSIYSPSFTYNKASINFVGFYHIPRVIPGCIPNATYFVAFSQFRLENGKFSDRQIGVKIPNNKSHSIRFSRGQIGNYQDIDKLIISAKIEYKDSKLYSIESYSGEDTLSTYETIPRPCDHRVPSSPCFTDDKFNFQLRDINGDLTQLKSKPFVCDTNLFIAKYKLISFEKFDPNYFHPVLEYILPTRFNNYVSDTVRQLIGDSIVKISQAFSSISTKKRRYSVINLKKGTAYTYTEYWLSPFKREEFSSIALKKINYNDNMHIGSGDVAINIVTKLPTHIWIPHGHYKTFSHDGTLYSDVIYKNGKQISKTINKKHVKFCKPCEEYY